MRARLLVAAIALPLVGPLAGGARSQGVVPTGGAYAARSQPTGVGAVQTPFAAGQVEAPDLRIAILGDSNSTTWSQGTNWPESVRHELASDGLVVEVHNFAVAAASACFFEGLHPDFYGGVQVGAALLEGHEYDYVVNHLGVVDTLFYASGQQMYDCMQGIEALVRTHLPDATYYVGTLHNLCPYYPDAAVRNESIDAFNALLFADGTDLIDMGTPLHCATHLDPDGIHTNVPGRLIKAEAVADAIRADLGLL